MKNFIYLLSILLAVACSDNDSTTPSTTTTEIVSNGITDLNSTGTVADQSPTEAKKTIYGKWDLSQAQRLMEDTCTFNYIEFTDDVYIMSFIAYGATESFSGLYVLNEDSDGTVSSVDLELVIDGAVSTIATLTNIVVTETNETISATFNKELFIPTGDEEFEICNGLNGDYEVDKDEPMTESESATADSNHAKLINSWNFTSRYQFNEDSSYEWFQEPCLIENEDGEDNYIYDCTPATAIVLTISTYGTYTLTFTGSSEGVKTMTDVWQWTDETQTAFRIDESQTLISIESLTDTDVVFTEEPDDVDAGANGVITYTFTTN